MLNSIIATIIGTTALSSSIIQPQSNSVHRDIFVAHDELLRRVLLARKPLARRMQQDEANCPGTPFLWKIIDDATGNHVGFGLGTMHLPSDVVTTEDAFFSIVSAVNDSCDVYGELNFYDNNTMSELIDCLVSAGESAGESFTLADIPDEGLREKVHAKIVEIILEYYDSNTTNAEFIASGFDDAPFSTIQDFIAHANTPAYMEKHADALFSGVDPKFLDFEILALGRPAGGLEDVSAQCDGTPALNSSAEALNQMYASDPDALASMVRDSINASYSTIFELYKCGDMDAFASEINSDDGLDLLLNGRNEQMAAKINEVLTASDSNKKILFAVGLAHWLSGNNTMISLLKDYGFSMEHIPHWNETQLDNPSDEYCGVVYNSEVGIFVKDIAIGNTTSETVPAQSSERDTSSTPTKLPSQEAEKENASAPEPAASASCTLIGIVTMVAAWAPYMLYYLDR